MEDLAKPQKPEATTPDFIQYEQPSARNYPPVFQVLLMQFGFALVLTVLGNLVFTIIAFVAHWDVQRLISNFSADADFASRWQMRLMLGLSHIFTFIGSGLLTIYLFYRQYPVKWPDYLRIRQSPKGKTVLVALLLMLAVMPLVLFLYNINKSLPIPESWRILENQTNEAIKGLLHMENALELLGNLFIIAFLPALGEELVFRGVLQQQLMRIIRNPWIALLLSAALFSFIHFQFEGFFPRMLLGLVLGWLYWKSRNFWVPVLAHFANNGLQVLAQSLYQIKWSNYDLDQDVSIPWYAAVLSAGMVILLAKFFNLLKN